MKKQILGLGLIALLNSCSEPNTKINTTKIVIGEYPTLSVTLKVVQIEGCEYFYSTYDRGAIFTHKGNCKNLIHFRH